MPHNDDTRDPVEHVTNTENIKQEEEKKKEEEKEEEEKEKEKGENSKCTHSMSDVDPLQPVISSASREETRPWGGGSRVLL